MSDIEKPEEAAAQPPQPEPATLSVSQLELESLRKEVQELREYKDKYLRQLAEADNARKRLHKERQEISQYAIKTVILDFLNPIDHMENALKYALQGSEEVKNWAHGFEMILTQFKDALSQNGVKAYESIGKPFNPHFHEAVDVVITQEQAPDVVISETLRGYMMGDSVLRPARVTVSKAPASPVQEELPLSEYEE